MYAFIFLFTKSFSLGKAFYKEMDTMVTLRGYSSDNFLPDQHIPFEIFCVKKVLELTSLFVDERGKIESFANLSLPLLLHIHFRKI